MTSSPAGAEQVRAVGEETPPVVRLPGQVQGRCLRDLRRQLLTSVRHHDLVVLDCSQVQELSPAGQALLVTAQRTARRRGSRLRLERPSAAMLTALRSTGLTHLLTDEP